MIIDVSDKKLCINHRWKYDNNKSQNGGLINLQFGLSMYHIASFSIDYLNSEKDKVRVVFFGSYSKSLNQSKIEPAFVYQQKGKETEFVVGGMNTLFIEVPNISHMAMGLIFLPEHSFDCQTMPLYQP